MKIENFILSILRKVESLKEGVIAYAYKSESGWWEISISDFELYMNDKRFKKLSTAWRTAAKAQKEKIIFVCGWMPTEEKLVRLSEDDNLIIDI